MAKTKPITARNACDRLFSQIVRSRGYCQACGTTENLQCSHIVSRKYAWTRTNEWNALCLCAGCHFKWHNDPAFAYQLIEKTVGIAQYEELRRYANEHVGQKFDWPAERERLKALHEEVVL